MRALLAADQGACLLLTGQNDFTISGWAYLQKVEKGKSFYNDMINRIFFWQDEHCKNALIWEVESAKEIHARYVKIYEDALNNDEGEQ